MIRRTRLSRLLGLGIFYFLSLSAFPPSDLRLAADLKRMMQLFEGEFDNYRQVSEEKEQKAQYPHEHIHSIFARVGVPAFGENVFYVKQYLDGDPAKVYRMRLYSFAANEKESAIELRIFAFPDEKAVNDAHLDPSKLSGLAPEKMVATPGCEVYWRREGEEFLGETKPTCRVVSKRLGKTIFITDNLKLNSDEIWINDQAKDEAGLRVFGHPGGIPYKLRRCRYFTGWAALRVSETGDEKTDYVGFLGLRIHDQGQIVPLVKPDGEKTKYSLQLAELVQQSARVPVLVIKVFEEGKDLALAYAWTDPGASRIGLNLRWIQAGLSFKK